jgi:hypothetical protein
MAATNYTPIQLYNSGTASTAPTNTNLAAGELALNYKDGLLYYKDDANVVQKIGYKLVPIANGGTGTTTAQLAINALVGSVTAGYVVQGNGTNIVLGVPPAIVDTNPIVKGSVDATKQMRFEVDGLTTGTTRVITVPNADITIAAAGANSDITSLSAITSINGGALGGFRNRIINGGMSIYQRNGGAAQTITAAAALAYTVDRFYAYCVGANVTGQQVAGSSQTQKRYQFTGAASVTAIGFGTRLEAKNTYDLNSQTVTIAADLANSLLTTVTWTLYRATTTDDTFGTLVAPTVTSVATGTFTVNSTVTKYSAQASITAASTTGLQLVLSVGAQTSGTWTIGNVQLELGSTATTFEQRPYGVELALCQRYLPVFTTNSSFSGYNISTTLSYVNIPFSVPARVSPSGISSGSAGFVYTAAGASQATNAIAWTGAVGTTSAFLQTTASAATLVAGNGTAGIWSSNILFTGCEL